MTVSTFSLRLATMPITSPSPPWIAPIMHWDLLSTPALLPQATPTRAPIVSPVSAPEAFRDLRNKVTEWTFSRGIVRTSPLLRSIMESGLTETSSPLTSAPSAFVNMIRAPRLPLAARPPGAARSAATANAMMADPAILVLIPNLSFIVMIIISPSRIVKGPSRSPEPCRAGRTRPSRPSARSAGPGRSTTRRAKTASISSG
jgi:hypothetical protein